MRPDERSTPPVRAIALAMLTVAAACTFATDVQLLEVGGEGDLGGFAFLDIDGDGQFTPVLDSPFVSTDVYLYAGVTGDTLGQTTTDANGLYLFADVTVGAYRVALDTAVYADSLVSLGPDTAVIVELNATQTVNVGAGYPHILLEDVGTTAAGTRVFTTGIALNDNTNFGDAQVHFKGATSSLRAIQVERGGLAPGDSARILGRVVNDNGRHALSNVTFAVLVPQVEIIAPTDLSTFDADNASGGADDAAFVRIRNAEITDTSTNAMGHFRFLADDGTGAVEFVIRDFLIPTIDTRQFRPDTVVRIQEASGLLSPTDAAGPVRWQFWPRDASDIALETKTADIALTMTADTLGATAGDTVRFTVVASNAGTHTAMGVQVSDTIPTGATFAGSSVTTGTYTSGTGLWNIGDMTPGAADTLTIDLEITAGPGLLTNLAESLGLITEVEGNPTNDLAAVIITIS